MEQNYTAKVWQEGDWFVAQCLEIDIASKGETEEDALANLKEALELRFEPQSATSVADLKGFRWFARSTQKLGRNNLNRP
ncbi:MAG TPA: type II toxin-antitoxin system HicB family antitoxin [Chloroflexia bacterium]|jgi:predicted RNase H-like HicB family nuclease